MAKENREDLVPRGASIAAGLSYIYGIVYGVLIGLPITNKLIVPGNMAETATRVLGNETLYRINSIAEILMYIGVAIIAVAFFVILEKASRGLALMALSLRLVEVALSCMAALGGFVALGFFRASKGSSPFVVDQLLDLAQTCLDAKLDGGRITPLFFCLGSILFFWLFWKTRQIPRLLSGIGLFSYVLFLLGDVADLLSPGASSSAILSNPLEIVTAIPVIVFELAIGFWLAFKGVRAGPEAPLRTSSAV